MKIIIFMFFVYCIFDLEDWLWLVCCWYLVVCVCDIVGVLVKVILLDEQLVIYCIKGQVVVVCDVCLYCGVLLILGFYEEEGIVCFYYGLCFGEDGCCNCIFFSLG